MMSRFFLDLYLAAGALAFPAASHAQPVPLSVERGDSSGWHDKIGESKKTCVLEKGAKRNGVKQSGVRHGGDLKRLKANDAQLNRSNFRGANLNRSKFRGASLKRSNCKRAKLKLANFGPRRSGRNLLVSYTNATLVSVNLGDVIYCATTMPDYTSNNAACVL
jgi:uncharacterized protein YjbI with pentapeptide repeats